MRRLLLLFVSAFLLVAAASPAPATPEQVASMRVLFGHQSVGWNILDGMNAIYARRGIPAANIVDGVAGMPSTGPGFAQVEIGSNGDPASKFADFQAAVATASGLNVAVMKLCFVDITADTDAESVFAQYRAMIDDVRASHPDIALVHATVPLTVDDPASNVVRQRYNSLMRATYGSAVFDLARMESTRPNGSRVKGRFRGQKYFALYPGYAADEGHLNAKGSRRAATAFLRAVSAAG